jgi:GNAT superfamily N-acetyltransferase
MTIASLELLAHRTWPCRIEDRLGDWILRAADGFTRRANSCLPLGEPGIPFHDAVAHVERWYRQRGLEPCFKIIPGADAQLDPLLQARGWTIATPSRTMVRDLGPDLPKPAAEFFASRAPDPDWLNTVSLWDGESADKARHHAELARRVPSAGYLRWLTSAGILAVGMVALEGDNSFLYDVVVRPDHRGHGIGRAFCTAVLSWSAHTGARSMALQVLESNTVARALYTSLGFIDHHRYHYRVGAAIGRPTRPPA